MKYKLTNTQIKLAKSGDKEYSLADGGGLRVMIRPSGAKVFVFNYAKPYSKKKTNITLGIYDQMSLQEARQEHSRLKALLAQNVDPVTEREQAKKAEEERLNLTFERVAVKWFEDRKLKANFCDRIAKDTWALFERYLIPIFGQFPITDITAYFAIESLKPLEKRGIKTTVNKLITKLNEVMRYALHRGILQSNPLAEIGKEFDKPTPKGMNTISPEELSELVRGLYLVRESTNTGLNAFYAVMLVLFTGSRPTEVAGAKWCDIDLSERIWRYQVQKGNKNLPQGRTHTVTLSSQAVAIFEQMKRYNTAIYPNQKNDFVFFSPTAKSGYITIETMRKVIIKAIGVNRLTTHGIRHLLSTSLNEREYNGDWIEKALSHRDKNKIRKIYNKAEYLEQRFSMLQEWADYIESLAPEYSLIA